MPKIRSKQILGETPVNPNDLTTKEYVDEALQNAGGKITIEDEGTEISSGTTIINFIGSDVKAELDSSGNYKVNVYIPTPTYAPFFNDVNSNGDSRISNISSTNRRISSPTSEGNPYKIGDWSGGDIVNTIRNSENILTYSTPNEFSLINESTTFNVTIFDADGISTIATNNLTIDSNKTFTENNIQTVVTNFQTDVDKFKATISVTINIDNILPNGGRFSVKLTHNNGTDGIYIFEQNDLFKDNEDLTANLTGTLTVVPLSPITKTISGIKYYTINTEWEVNVDGINNLNSNTYPLTQQVRIEDNNFYISEIIDIHGNGGSYYNFDTNTWDNSYNTSGATFNKTDWITDQPNFINWTHSGSGVLNTNVRITVYDWEQVVQAYSQNYNYIIDTLVDDSDRNSERFRSETDASYPRLQDDLITPWDNTQTLTGNTGLQILGDRLVYPQFNFENYLPNSIGDNINYTTINTDRHYIRKFDTNSSLFVGNGKIVLTDHNISESDLENDIVIIELSIDSGVTWMTFKGQFGLYPNSCRVYIDSYGLIGNPVISNDSLAFTFGNPPNNYADHTHLRVTFTYTGRDKYIGGIDILNNEIDGGNEWA